MQIVYFFTFLSVLVAYQSVSSNLVATTEVDGSKIFAEHMQLWHQTAIEQCITTTCNTGHVKLEQHQVSEIPSRFKTRFDLNTGWMATHFDHNAIESSILNDRKVAAELSILNREQTFQLGTWDAKQNKIIFHTKSEFSPNLTHFIASYPSIRNLSSGSPILVSHIAP